MAVTKSWESKVLATNAKAGTAAGRVGWREFSWLACSSLLVAAGLLMVYSAKTQSFPDLSAALAHGDLLAAAGTLWALAFFLEDRIGWAAVCFALAVLSKESFRK